MSKSPESINQAHPHLHTPTAGQKSVLRDRRGPDHLDRSLPEVPLLPAETIPHRSWGLLEPSQAFSRACPSTPKGSSRTLTRLCAHVFCLNLPAYHGHGGCRGLEVCSARPCARGPVGRGGPVLTENRIVTERQSMATREPGAEGPSRHQGLSGSSVSPPARQRCSWKDVRYGAPLLWTETVTGGQRPSPFLESGGRVLSPEDDATQGKCSVASERRPPSKATPRVGPGASG